MAACLIALLAGAEPRDLGEAIESFPGVETPHRVCQDRGWRRVL